MASLVRVRHVQLPLGPSFPCDTPREKIEEFLDSCVEGPESFFEAVCVVLKDGRPVGWFDTLEMCNCIGAWGAGDVLGDMTDGISLSQVIAADVPFLDAAEVLSADDYPFHFVLDGTKLSGWVNYFCLFGPPGTMCIFALMMELEAACLDLCRAFSEQCWSVLSETRKNKAMDVWRKRVEHPRLHFLKSA